MHNLASQQVVGRNRMSAALEEKITEAKFVGIAGVYRIEKRKGLEEERGGISGSLIEIFNTLEVSH